VNGGSLRNGIAAGKITRGDILNVFPYDNCIASAKMTGQQILDGLEFAARFYPVESGGFLGVSGIEFTIDKGIESSVTLNEYSEFTGVSGEYRVKDVKINGEPIDLRRTYTASSLDYLLTDGGDGFPFSGQCEIYSISDELYNDLIQRYIIEELNGKIPETYQNPGGLGRIRIINSKENVPASEQSSRPAAVPQNSSAASAPKTGDAAPVGSIALLFAGFALIAITAKKKSGPVSQ
jgi:2',3'-cyclic-nucleotide 2'-phosphodiesterase (5'-nucleotidase family)